MPPFASNALSGFILGLTTGPFCFAACFPVLLSLVLGDKSQPAGETWWFVGRFIAGRFVAYMALGIISSTVGSALGAASHTLCGGAWIVLSLALIAQGLGLSLPRGGLCEHIDQRFGKKCFPYVMGGLTAVNVCPPVLLAMTYTLDSGSAVAGITVFGSFFVATSLFILPAAFAGHLHQ
jgi:sulfite exporter TauE/SafE